MSSLLSSQVASQASPANGDVTSGAMSRTAHDATNTMQQGELNAVASGTNYMSGGKKRKSAKKGMSMKSWPSMYGGRKSRRIRVHTKKGSYLRKKASRRRH